MFIFVRSLVPSFGWHDEVWYADDYSKRVLGSEQHCCRKPTYYESCKRDKNVFLLQPAAPGFLSDLVMVGRFRTEARSRTPRLSFGSAKPALGGTSLVHHCQIPIP